MHAAEKDLWDVFAADAARLDCPLYARLALAVAGDAPLQTLAARARPGQPHPNLLFGAVHYLLLRGADHPLRETYATLGGTAPPDNVFALFADFVAAHRAAVGALVETKVVNTNEVARAAVLRAGFAALAASEARPLHLIEIGPSAGLNLLWDRYGVRYRRGDALVRHSAPGAALVLDCELRGARTPPLDAMPRIAGRLGLEKYPVYLSRAADRDWLRALIWPDQPGRLQRLDRAIALARRAPPEIRGGDALDLLPAALAAAPPQEAACVFHSLALYQFSDAMRAALAAILDRAGRQRPLWHLAFERGDADDYTLTLSRPGQKTAGCRLAIAQSHGGWIEWLA